MAIIFEVDIYMYILLKEFFHRRNIQNLALFPLLVIDVVFCKF